MSEAEYIAERIDAGSYLIPGHMVGAVKRYIINGIPPGSFLTAVLCNDLREAYARADDENAASMMGWVQFLYNYAPYGCWGSPEIYSDWLARAQEQAA